MKLDIGCGLNPKGNVNIDIEKNIPKQKFIPNFVLADAHNLPFRANVFTMVISSHVLEHLYAPLHALKEIHRVCNHKLILRLPSQFSLDKSKSHIYTWNTVTLENLLSLVFRKVEIGYTSGWNVCMHGRLGKYFPVINVLLSKLGIHTEFYAICYKSSLKESKKTRKRHFFIHF